MVGQITAKLQTRRKMEKTSRFQQMTQPALKTGDRETGKWKDKCGEGKGEVEQGARRRCGGREEGARSQRKDMKRKRERKKIAGKV